ncbi:MAG: hypothetical protein AAGA31_03580, partial [Bacteroidota bacterium]
MRIFSLLICLAVFTPLSAQEGGDKQNMFFIGFADKAGTPHKINQPEAFLSERALIRRALHETEITEMDLPISPVYEDKVAATGAQIWLRSKWMNG